MSPLTLSVPEAARALGISKNTAYTLIRTGRLPHVRLGTRIRIPHQALVDWLADEAERSTPR
jgi:excisionase family DNA binding protein